MDQSVSEPTFEQLVGSEVVEQIEIDAAAVRRTSDLDELVKAKFCAPHYGLLKNVGDGTGARNYRWADWLAMGLWPSRGLTLIGIECKVSRTDWLKELKTPAKAEAIAQFCDEWYLAVGDPKIVKDGELPENWGLLVPGKGGLRVSKPAVRLSPVPIDRSFLAAIIRRVSEQSVDAEALKQAEQSGYAKGEKSQEYYVKRAEKDYHNLTEKLKRFESAAGITLDGFEYGWKQPEDFAKAFKSAMQPRRDTNREALEALLSSAKFSRERLDQVIERLAYLDSKDEQNAPSDEEDD